MNTQDLRALWQNSSRRIDQLQIKYALTGALTRAECDDVRHCTQRIGLVARELWLRAGKPPGFEDLEHPIQLSPLPASLRSDYSRRLDNKPLSNSRAAEPTILAIQGESQHGEQRTTRE